MVTDSENPNLVPEPHSLLDKTIWFCLNNKLVVLLMVIVILVWGAMVAPFDWDLGSLPRVQCRSMRFLTSVRTSKSFSRSGWGVHLKMSKTK